MRPKPTVYIAAPLFNPIQIGTIKSVEDAIRESGFGVFSPRIESERFVPVGDNKKDPAMWQHVYDCNIRGMRLCDFMVSVLSYELPPEFTMGVAADLHTPAKPMTSMPITASSFRSMELPDTGTVFEMGYFQGAGKMVIGYHPHKKAEHLNVMLTHGCAGLISGIENLRRFFYGNDDFPNNLFDWSVCESWAAQQEGS